MGFSSMIKTFLFLLLAYSIFISWAYNTSASSGNLNVSKVAQLLPPGPDRNTGSHSIPVMQISGGTI
jgi:hypothetical protein